MQASVMLRMLGLVMVIVQMSSAFRKRVRGAIQSSTEPKPLLAALEQAIGGQEWATHELHEIENDLKNTFKALPKNGRGAVEAPSVRYALHRFFIQRHGWMVKGLETGGGAWDAESPISAMDAHVPKEMRELFEDHLGDYGLNLHELAVLAATMNKMFQRDVEKRLRVIYAGLNFSTEKTFELPQAHEVMLTYLATYVAGPQLENLTPDYAEKAVFLWRKRYPRTQEAEDLLTEIQNEMAPGRTFDFGLVLKVVSRLGQQLGKVEDTECQALKKLLVSAEHREGSGRVRLGDFYSASKFFAESRVYLRATGSLDESNPEDPKVLIPNYLANPTMCLTPSGYFSMCCFDGCEDLMDQIEGGLEAPMGTPDKIASLASSLGASNKTLSAFLLQLLDDVAGHHGGMIPIHGRLFSQWMHQAFPRECSFPHASAEVDHYGKQDAFTFAPVSPEDKHKYLGLASRAKAEISNEADAPMWTMHEELVDKKTLEKHIRRSSKTEEILLLGTVSFLAFMVAKSRLEPVLSSRMSSKNKLL
jgi:hypothetical protein